MKAFYESRTYDPEIPLSISTIKDLNFVAHWHKDIEVIHVCEGRIGVGINSGYCILEAGDIAICGSNDIHYYVSEGMKSTVILLIFRPEILYSFKHWPVNTQPHSVFLTEDPNPIQADIRAILYGIISEMQKKQDLYPIFTDLRIVELFLTLFRNFPSYYEDIRKNTGGFEAPSEFKPMQKALKYLEENYTQEISLEQISNEVNLSRFYFSRLFRKTTGMSFNAYLNRIRIDKAEKLLKNTKKPVITIAYETGFFSIRTFNRLFRAIKGSSPKSARQG